MQVIENRLQGTGKWRLQGTGYREQDTTDGARMRALQEHIRQTDSFGCVVLALLHLKPARAAFRPCNLSPVPYPLFPSVSHNFKTGR
jgi:hypothetical protein